MARATAFVRRTDATGGPRGAPGRKQVSNLHTCCPMPLQAHTQPLGTRMHMDQEGGHEQGAASGGTQPAGPQPSMAPPEATEAAPAASAVQPSAEGAVEGPAAVGPAAGAALEQPPAALPAAASPTASKMTIRSREQFLEVGRVGAG